MRQSFEVYQLHDSPCQLCAFSINGNSLANVAPLHHNVSEPSEGYTAKKEKKSTYEQTLELLEQGKDVHEIARIRQVSVQTIGNHFAYLIRSEKIELTDVMSPKRISELATMFDGFEGTSLSPLKEKVGNKVTWEELKLYQAHSML